MEIIPNPYRISIEYTNMQTGCESIEETKEKIETVYQELTEKKIHITTGTLGNLSFAFTDYVKQNQKIDTDASYLAGGTENE